MVVFDFDFEHRHARFGPPARCYRDPATPSACRREVERRLVATDPRSSWLRTQERVKLVGLQTTHRPEVPLSHSQMLNTRRKRQKTRKHLATTAKKAKALGKRKKKGTS